MTYEELRKTVLAYAGHDPSDTSGTFVQAITSLQRLRPFPACIAGYMAEYIEEQRHRKVHVLEIGEYEQRMIYGVYATKELAVDAWHSKGGALAYCRVRDATPEVDITEYDLAENNEEQSRVDAVHQTRRAGGVV